MNKCTIIGNLTADPELRPVTSDKGTHNVCNFSVAVNDCVSNDATFFRVSAWRGLADVCNKYLRKGDKVMVSGSVSAKPYTTRSGTNIAGLYLTADEVEFLTPKRDAAEGGCRQQENQAIQQEAALGHGEDYASRTSPAVVMADELPF